MKCTYVPEDKQLTISLTEDIDHHSVEEIRRKIDNEITRCMPRKVVFDFNSVSFMDSAGIGLIIGRYKFANMLGGKLEVANLTQSVRKIFEMSGILKLIPVTELYYGKASDLYPDIKPDENFSENFIERLSNDKNFYMELDSPDCDNKVPNEGVVIKIDNMKPAAFKLKCFRFLNKEQQALDKGESNIEDEA